MAKTIADLLAEQKAAAQEIVTKAEKEARELTDAEMKAFDEAVSEYDKLKERGEKAAKMTERLNAMNSTALDFGDADGDPEEKAGSLGERFVKAKGYRELQATAKELGGLGRNANINIAPTQVGSMKEFFASRKGAALTTDLAHIQNIRLPMIDQVVRPQLSLLDVISRGTTGGPFEYLQVISVTRNTAIIPENTGDDATDKLKPQSTFATQLESAKVYDYADGYTVTNQLLQDDQALASFLNNEFTYSFDSILADKLLNGTGTNGEPKGLLNTTGVQQQAFTSGTDDPWAMVKAIRQAITKLNHVGASVNAILVSPEDAEALDLWRDNEGRFMGGGAYGSENPSIWRRPIVVSEQMEQGQLVVGDFRQLALLDRSGLSIQAFNQHKDYAARNLTYVRAELRAAQAIWRPAHFVVVEKSV